MIIVQLTDLHCRQEGLACNRVVEANMLTERAFRAVADLRVKPDAIVISGDLVDCGTKEAYAAVRAALARHLRDAPIYVIPGNHDRRQVMKTEFADFPGMSEHPEFAQYAVEGFPVRLVMLDTVIPGATDGELCAERLAWLDETLTRERTKPTIVVMHHPPFLCGIAHADMVALREREKFAAVIERHPQVERILCGHHHRPVTARVAHAIASIAPSVAHQIRLDLHGERTAMFMMEPPAFQIHLWNPSDGVVSHTAFVESYPGPFPFFAERE